MLDSREESLNPFVQQSPWSPLNFAVKRDIGLNSMDPNPNNVEYDGTPNRYRETLPPLHLKFFTPTGVTMGYYPTFPNTFKSLT